MILTNVVLKLEYEPLSREKIKEVATSMNDIQKNIFLHTCEMSYRVENVLKEMEELSTALYLQGFDRDRIAYELKKRGIINPKMSTLPRSHTYEHKEILSVKSCCGDAGFRY